MRLFRHFGRQQKGSKAAREIGRGCRLELEELEVRHLLSAPTPHANPAPQPLRLPRQQAAPAPVRPPVSSSQPKLDSPPRPVRRSGEAGGRTEHPESPARKKLPTTPAHQSMSDDLVDPGWLQLAGIRLNVRPGQR